MKKTGTHCPTSPRKGDPLTKEPELDKKTLPDLSANRDLKTIRFAKPVSARFIKLVARSGHTSVPSASLAELSLIESDAPYL
jgi:hypothetical protein